MPQANIIEQLKPTGDKSQAVRLLDVFVFGPLMIQAAKSQKKEYFRTALTVIGIGTIIFNGWNYLINEKKKTDQLGALNQRIAPDPRTGRPLDFVPRRR